MTTVGLISIIDVCADAAKVPFAALTLAVCVYCALKTAQLKCRGPEGGLANIVPWLALALVAAAVIRIFLYPHNAGLMNDDFYLAQSARRMIDPAFNPINKFDVPAGWPLIVSISFWVNGIDQYAMFYANAIIGCLSAVALFYLVYGATGRLAAAVVSAFFLALSPLHSLWSTSGSGDIAAAFFMVVSIAALFWFFRLHYVELIFLSMYAASFASQISAENLLLFAAIPAAIFLFSKELFVPRMVARNLVFPTILTLPAVVNGLMAYTAKAAAVGADSVFAKAGIVGTVVNNLADYISAAAGERFFVFVLIIAAVGLSAGLKKDSRAILFFVALGAAYLVASGIFLGNAAYMERLLLNTEIMLIAIIGFGVKSVVEKRPKLRVPMMAAGLILAVALSYGSHADNLAHDNDYFAYGREITNIINWVNEELPSNSTLIVEDPSPYQFSTRTNVITPGMAAAFAGDLPPEANVYMIVDISAQGIPGDVCGLFDLEMIKRIDVSQPIKPCGFDLGAYLVKAINSNQKDRSESK
ncbi:MAG TPA: hypothetical protein PLS19_05845 [bacterium]|nr:hypothetical protein [bacterium]